MSNETLNIGQIELPSLDNDFDNKFVLVKKTNSVNKSNKWIIICKPVKYHSEIVDSLRIKSNDFIIYGGGLIKFDLTNKKLTAYGESYGYGCTEKDIVDVILSDYCKINDLKYKSELETKLYF